ncbi:MAG: trigger factor [Spirochaetia bacterium]|jgi:trigger factor|nr:trigger factor [Spirochaetia bacterium]
MIASKEVTAKDNSSVELTVTIKKDSIKEAYTKLLNDYSKKIQIKGFRKGKAPAHILEQKYGEGIKEEAAMNIVEESLKVVFDEIDEKPLPYSVPALQEGSELVNFDEDYRYTVVYDVFPTIKLGTYKDIKIESPDAKVLKKDEDREIEKLREQNAVVIEKTEGNIVKDDIVTINYVELDENGKEIEGTAREDFVFTVGTGYNIYKLDDDILGMKKDEEKILDKDFPEDFDNKDLAGKKVKIKVKVTTIKVNELPELDDELAQDISEKYKTLKDLRADIKNKMKVTLDKKLKELQFERVMDKIIDTSEIPVPESMLKAEMDNSWQNFMVQSRMDETQLLQILEMQGKTKELLLEEWRPNSTKSLKVQLLLAKLIEEEKIEATEEEVNEEIKTQAIDSGQKLEEFKELIEKNNYTAHIENDVKNKKFIDFLISKNTITKGKKVDYLDLLENNF